MGIDCVLDQVLVVVNVAAYVLCYVILTKCILELCALYLCPNRGREAKVPMNDKEYQTWNH